MLPQLLDQIEKEFDKEFFLSPHLGEGEFGDAYYKSLRWNIKKFYHRKLAHLAEQIKQDYIRHLLEVQCDGNHLIDWSAAKTNTVCSGYHNPNCECHKVGVRNPTPEEYVKEIDHIMDTQPPAPRTGGNQRTFCYCPKCTNELCSSKGRKEVTQGFMTTTRQAAKEAMELYQKLLKEEQGDLLYKGHVTNEIAAKVLQSLKKGE